MGTSADFDNRLIELVRANPSLYEREVRQAPYDSHRKKKTELWCSIATSLKTDVSTCITRWNHVKERLRREQHKEHSDWSLLGKLSFMGQHKHGISYHNNERKATSPTATPAALINVSWRALSPGELIEHEDEEDALQEAMDEQHVVAPTPASTSTTTPIVNDDPMKRIDALLQGLGANRSKAEKKILAYLCKCNLRALNEEQIDDIFI